MRPAVARADLDASPARALGVRVDELEAVLIAALPHLEGSPAGRDVADRARAALNRAPDPAPLETIGGGAADGVTTAERGRRPMLALG